MIEQLANNLKARLNILQLFEDVVVKITNSHRCSFLWTNYNDEKYTIQKRLDENTEILKKYDSIDGVNALLICMSKPPENIYKLWNNVVWLGMSEKTVDEVLSNVNRLDIRVTVSLMEAEKFTIESLSFALAVIEKIDPKIKAANRKYPSKRIELSSDKLTDKEQSVLDRIAFIPEEKVTNEELAVVRLLLFKTGIEWFEGFENIEWGISKEDNPHLLNDIWHNWCDAIHITRKEFLRHLSELNYKLKKRHGVEFEKKIANVFGKNVNRMLFYTYVGQHDIAGAKLNTNHTEITEMTLGYTQSPCLIICSRVLYGIFSNIFLEKPVNNDTIGYVVLTNDGTVEWFREDCFLKWFTLESEPLTGKQVALAVSSYFRHEAEDN